ncbi:MAG: hypothetical protein HXY43_26035 [Fischerella sp.]|uniref:hypothetical protein n=1 Tax=Fischerella sp. TaxID=1191 RepID=UPI0018452696|nr:hypothetical protein [Fischerella sp.]NWF62599.1 hypothetical protein [Fischerella sp.]
MTLPVVGHGEWSKGQGARGIGKKIILNPQSPLPLIPRGGPTFPDTQFPMPYAPSQRQGSVSAQVQI